jgi:hypothetical protein
MYFSPSFVMNFSLCRSVLPGYLAIRDMHRPEGVKGLSIEFFLGVYQSFQIALNKGRTICTCYGQERGAVNAKVGVALAMRSGAFRCVDGCLET